MKSHFSRVVALGFLVCASVPTWPQPPEPVKPQAEATRPQPKKKVDYDFAEDNADALALIGAFQSKMTRAKSYRGRAILSVSTATRKKVVEIEESWLADPKQELQVSKSVSNLLYTFTSNGKTTFEKVRSWSDGIKSRLLYETNNTWSEEEWEFDETPSILETTRESLNSALVNFAEGREFNVEDVTIEGKERIVVTHTDPAESEYIFDAPTGELQSWKRTVAGFTTEFRWLQNEWNVPLPESNFKWELPQGAKKTDPDHPGIRETDLFF